MIINLGQKHNLEVVDIFNEDGTLNEEAQIYIGEDRFEARKKIVKELEEKGHIVKIEDYTSEVGYSERTDAVVEPRFKLAMVGGYEKNIRAGVECCDE